MFFSSFGIGRDSPTAAPFHKSRCKLITKIINSVAEKIKYFFFFFLLLWTADLLRTVAVMQRHKRLDDKEFYGRKWLRERRRRRMRRINFIQGDRDE